MRWEHRCGAERRSDLTILLNATLAAVLRLGTLQWTQSPQVGATAVHRLVAEMGMSSAGCEKRSDSGHTYKGLGTGGLMARIPGAMRASRSQSRLQGKRIELKKEHRKDGSPNTPSQSTSHLPEEEQPMALAEVLKPRCPRCSESSGPGAPPMRRLVRVGRGRKGGGVHLTLLASLSSLDKHSPHSQLWG